MDNLATALACFDSATNMQQKAIYGDALAEAARRLIDSRSGEKRHSSLSFYDSSVSHIRDKSGCIYLGVSMNGTRPFTYHGIEYASIQNAFQAQKAPRSERSRFSDVPPSEAVLMGRRCKIDSDKWDANRVLLMTELYRAQIAEHQDMSVTLYEWRSKTINEDAIPDPFWKQTMPTIWKTIGCELANNDAFLNWLSSTKGGATDDEGYDDVLATVSSTGKIEWAVSAGGAGEAAEDDEDAENDEEDVINEDEADAEECTDMLRGFDEADAEECTDMLRGYQSSKKVRRC